MASLYDGEGMPFDRTKHAINIELQIAGQMFYAQASRAFTAYRTGKEGYREDVLRLIDSVTGDFRAAIGALTTGDTSTPPDTPPSADVHLRLLRDRYPALFSANGDDIFDSIREKHDIRR